MMEVQVNAKVLGKALARVKPGVSRRSNLPILFHVRITAAGDTLRLDTSNLDAVKAAATLACHTSREGSAVVPFKQLLDAVKAAKNADITLRVQTDGHVGDTDGRLAVRAPHWAITLDTMPTDDFPPMREASVDSPSVSFNSAAFADTVARVQPFCSKDDSRPVLTTVNVNATSEGSRYAATDSYRLIVHEALGARVHGDLDPNSMVRGSLLKHAAAASKANKASEVVIAFDTETVSIRIGEVTLSEPRVTGQFPNVEQLRPDGRETRARIAGVHLADTAKALAPMIEGKSPLVLDFAQDASRAKAGASEATLDAELDGPDIAIGVNAEFLAAVATALSDGNGSILNLDTTTAMRAITVSSDTLPDTWALLMPIRI